MAKAKHHGRHVHPGPRRSLHARPTTAPPGDGRPRRPRAAGPGKPRGRRKRPFDLLVIGVSLVVGLPLWILLLSALSVLVYFDSGLPILFKTRRVGRGGKPFDMYKFRTMKRGAEHQGLPITLPNDPRITRVGRFLRKTGLDELPQLLSVCKGDMSLVGPRPYNLRSHDYYVAWNPRFARRLQVRPGLAGPAALWGSTSNPANRLAWDLAYIRNQSLCWDMILIVRCALVVFVAGWERKQDETSAPRAHDTPRTQISQSRSANER